MAYREGYIKAPVVLEKGTGDIETAININSGDLETVCKSQAINKWSKMKPVAFPDINPDRTQPVSAYGKKLWWWKGHPKIEEVPAGLVIGNYTCTDKCAWITCCGVKMLGFHSQIDVLKALNPIGNMYHTGDDSPLADNFIYVPPTGGNDEPYRQADFNYYWSNANYNIIPDYGTESGTSRVNINNPESAKVKCSIMSAAVLDKDAISELSFNDLFGSIDAYAGFTVITGLLTNSTFIIANISRQITRNDDFVKEIELDLKSYSSGYGKTVIAIYCAYVSHNGETYYIPLMQSTGDHPNTIINTAPKRKIYNSWYLDNTTPYYALTFTQKQNYGSSFPWNSVTSMTSFNTNGVMNRWYLKLEMPRKSSTYTFGRESFKIEFAGQFLNSRGQINLVYYTITSNSNPTKTRFVLKNNEVTTQWDWGTTENVIVTPGTGSQTCYLAILDNLFANAGGVEVIYGGTVWRIRLFFLNGQSEFSPEPDVEYGSLGDNHLNITVDPVS